ncbi:family 43 glycosylhydrolase, partial [Klebsiella pneumoniae]|uniref:family 43 glycosylhydrolase n=1 Tax=Klebsiella pneumoniae TaxID=573 RepID=UPI0021BE8B86
MSLIQNPILRGFNADPSIIRVEDTYYIANSTFEWFPGVRLHESKDLKNGNDSNLLIVFYVQIVPDD